MYTLKKLLSEIKKERNRRKLISFFSWHHQVFVRRVPPLVNYASLSISLSVLLQTGNNHFLPSNSYSCNFKTFIRPNKSAKLKIQKIFKHSNPNNNYTLHKHVPYVNTAEKRKWLLINKRSTHTQRERVLALCQAANTTAARASPPHNILDPVSVCRSVFVLQERDHIYPLLLNKWQVALGTHRRHTSTPLYQSSIRFLVFFEKIYYVSRVIVWIDIHPHSAGNYIGISRSSSSRLDMGSDWSQSSIYVSHFPRVVDLSACYRGLWVIFRSLVFCLLIDELKSSSSFSCINWSSFFFQFCVFSPARIWIFLKVQIRFFLWYYPKGEMRWYKRFKEPRTSIKKASCAAVKRVDIYVQLTQPCDYIQKETYITWWQFQNSSSVSLFTF